MSHPDTRPKFLNLLHIRLPVGAVASIAHRISGVLLFLSLPFAAYLLELSLKGQAGFEQVRTVLDQGLIKLLTILLAWSICHHLLAGIRFLLLDLDIGLNKPSARRMAWMANLLAPLFALALLWRIW